MPLENKHLILLMYTVISSGNGRKESQIFRTHKKDGLHAQTHDTDSHNTFAVK